MVIDRRVAEQPEIFTRKLWILCACHGEQLGRDLVQCSNSSFLLLTNMGVLQNASQIEMNIGIG